MVYEKIKRIFETNSDIKRIELGETAFENIWSESTVSYTRKVDGKNKVDQKLRDHLTMFRYRLYFDNIPLVKNKKLDQNDIKIIRKIKNSKRRGLTL
jgi:hypothetical protein